MPVEGRLELVRGRHQAELVGLHGGDDDADLRVGEGCGAHSSESRTAGLVEVLREPRFEIKSDTAAHASYCNRDDR